MKTFTSKEAKNKFGLLMDAAQREPVTITKHSRPNVVIISAERYDELEELEEKAWIAKAQDAEKNGYLSPKESAEFIESILNVEA